MYKSVVYEGDKLLGEVEVYPQNQNQNQDQNGVVFDKEIRISHFSQPSERCPPLAVLHTITSNGVCFKMESKSHSQDSPLYLLHSSCSRENKTAVMLLGGEELHLVAMSSRKNDGRCLCFWGFNVALGLYNSCLVMLNLRCLGIVFDLDETLIVANTMCSSILQDALPPKELNPAEKHCKVTDAVLCLGTSLQITPACNLPLKSLRGGGKFVIASLQIWRDGNREKENEFKGRDLVQDLGRLVKGSIEPVRDFVSGFEFAPGALGSLLSYAELLADESNYGSYSIRQYNLDSYMRLDSAAMRALNVMESKTDANKNFSLFGLLNRTCTAGMGKRLLHMWLKQPLLDVNEINSRLDLVQAFVEDTALRQDLRQHLKRISDMERLMRYLEKRRAVLQHIVKLYQSSIRLPYIKSALERYDGQFSSLIKQRYLDPLEFLTDDDHLNKFIGLVEASVDLDQLDNGEYMISSSYDPKLSELRDEQESLEQKIHNLHKQTANDLDLAVDKALKLDKGTQFGHVFRITKKEEPKVRKKLNTQFIVLETRKDGVKFTNTRLKKLGDQYQKILDEYKSCQKELVARVVQTAATFSEVFESLAVLLSELDVLLSFADLAVSCPTPYTRPDITTSDVGDIVLEGSRHPCVEAQDWVNFIPNDCKLVRGKSWFQIITGPNMGGKSTFIRQVGVNILMAQVGSFVPCDKAIISVRDCIFARVGAGDCQLRGVSTFMQEMLETAAILKGATDKSLIIIDELGRGTSTYDGFGLAWAICEHLVEVIKAPTLFATHFHELTALAHENADHETSKKIVGVANYHVSAHIDTSSHKLTMLYKVEPGACDQSFGIHVAEFANFPESVVSLAREKAAELEDFSPITIIANDTKQDVGSKRKRECDPDDMSIGAARARQFLKEFSELPLDKMDVKEALDQVHKLKNDMEKDAVNSLWLQQFL